MCSQVERAGASSTAPPLSEPPLTSLQGRWLRNLEGAAIAGGAWKSHLRCCVSPSGFGKGVTHGWREDGHPDPKPAWALLLQELLDSLAFHSGLEEPQLADGSKSISLHLTRSLQFHWNQRLDFLMTEELSNRSEQGRRQLCEAMCKIHISTSLVTY